MTSGPGLKVNGVARSRTLSTLLIPGGRLGLNGSAVVAGLCSSLLYKANERV